MSRTRLAVATSNPGKLREIGEALKEMGCDLELVPYGGPMPEEDGATYAQNALKKALWAHKETGLWAMAEDSGLEVPSLGGWPGVRSARVAPSDAERIGLLLSRLRGSSDRRALFVCCACVVGEGFCLLAEGFCFGEIAEEPRGEGGFGYDPVFVPEGFSATFAEMEPSAKNRVSHRGVALRGLWRLIRSCGLC